MLLTIIYIYHAWIVSRWHLICWFIVVIIIIPSPSSNISIVAPIGRGSFGNNCRMIITVFPIKIKLHNRTEIPHSTIMWIDICGPICCISFSIGGHIVIKLVYTTPRRASVVYISIIPSCRTDARSTSIIDLCTASKYSMRNKISTIICARYLWKVKIWNRTFSGRWLIFVIITSSPINNSCII